MRNSVLDHTKLNTKISELRLLCNNEINNGKTIVIVEGLSDQKLYNKYFDDQKVKIFKTNTCAWIPEIIMETNTDSSFNHKIIAIKDSDFDRLTNVSNIDNLFLTDTHDWETMCLKYAESELTNNIYSEHSIPSTEDIFNTVIEHIEFLSYIRFFNEKSIMKDRGLLGINLDIKNFSLFYNGNSNIDQSDCLDSLKKVANNATYTHFPTEREIMNFISNNTISDKLQLTRGHDLIIAIAVRVKSLGYSSTIGESNLEIQFRDSFVLEKFRQTQLFQNIDAWRTSNGINDFWK